MDGVTIQISSQILHALHDKHRNNAEQFAMEVFKQVFGDLLARRPLKPLEGPQNCDYIPEEITQAVQHKYFKKKTNKQTR